MIDHLVGRPSPSWKRTQVFLVIFFWLWRILKSNSGPPRLFWLRKLNRILQRFTPWQIVVSTLTAMYAVRNFDKVLGLGSPEPLAGLYSNSYYRATWINTGLDAGFATAMSIRPKWLRDICSIVFSVYYIIYANEADEKLRRFRAVPTVEMLRSTWEKTTNPYIRLVVRVPKVTMCRKILLPRPRTSTYTRPITAYLYFALPVNKLSEATELILDYPGGGFVAMSPAHHEERLRTWAVTTRRPVLSIDYGKAPEYPYPFAIDEAFDTYRVLVESAGSVIGMSGKKFNVVISGDSAGAALAVNVVIKTLEYNQTHASRGFALPLPLTVILSYAALDFNFTSWMSQDHLRILRTEQSSGNLQELAEQKDHLSHISPLAMGGDSSFAARSKRAKLQRRSSWKDTIRGLAHVSEKKDHSTSPTLSPSSSRRSLRRRTLSHVFQPPVFIKEPSGSPPDTDSELDEDEDYSQRREEDRPLQARVKYIYPHSTRLSTWLETGSEKQQQELSAAVLEADNKAVRAITREGKKGKEPIGVRLTMTSRSGYFQDRVISPSMMRAMAILYIGPYRNPDFSTDYYLSPILTPNHLLAQFPPLLMQCGEKDPFVDDTVIFAGRVREAKRARKVELDLHLSGKSARFGENLRMSEANPGSIDMALLQKERDKFAQETEDDWVQMELFAEWSHGYLQMATLMTEAKAVSHKLTAVDS
ncbi:alpha/beta-hydrolase [Dendrothele bispora CBS 962.96]|uniref:Alpha/beta-hydrolase n=1 Tax=Dendrothele bispora (strain CBS 962.96) TaxID=1314807 RepID=A0A4V4HHF7_DENBC|nr:alpha/beta-hydrolase [Dendrothele bispora CBS 962.96]